MSLGDDLLGEELFGEDDAEASDEAYRAKPAAIFFDGTTRDFPMEDGHYVGIHPVDAEMQMVTHIALGSIAGSPETGNKLHEIEYLDPLRLGATVRDEMRLRTKALVDRGDVTIDDITHETFGNGGLAVAVDYYNERLTDRVKKTAKAST